MMDKKELTIDNIKRLGKSKNIDHFNLLKYVYFKTDTVSNKREIASSIGRYAQLYKDDVYFFIEDEILKKKIHGRCISIL